MEEEDLVELLALLLPPPEVEDAELRAVARGGRREPHPEPRAAGGGITREGREARRRGSCPGRDGATSRRELVQLRPAGGSSPGEDGRSGGRGGRDSGERGEGKGGEDRWSGSAGVRRGAAAFLFLYFLKTFFFTEIYFRFHIAHTRGLCAKTIYIYLHVGPCRPLPGGRGTKL